MFHFLVRLGGKRKRTEKAADSEEAEEFHSGCVVKAEKGSFAGCLLKVFLLCVNYSPLLSPIEQLVGQSEVFEL